ncbi:ABC transporter permease [Celeribacter indicus]|uniref:Putative alkanesulfonate transport protein, ABC superfamily, inner membrane component n=1 Tax=Celeribacter indicus TaxID=1208324 RepID=A0A0B5E220_9RHOB|nr:ABC transporter permease subunit [Celeribacter indicus]AJE47096.1 putative alkanesulfonate transport protein, ABC superfamily, inner membrane component [Celeribacter indicus]SDW91006.1 sulfonate transport system permease protein [Celeribacter indicus]
MSEVTLKGLVLPGVVVAVWGAAAAAGLLNGPMAVTPAAVLRVPFADPAGVEIWAGIGTSLLRLVTGGVIGGVLGLATGLAFGLLRPLRRTLSPTVDAFRQIALFAWIPLLTSWFGNGEVAKIVFIALATFFPLVLSAEQGVRNVAPALREAVQVMGLSRRRQVTALYLPAALPSIAVGVQIALISSWIGTVGAEYAIGNGRGLGSYIAAAREQFRMDITLVGVAALALVGVALHAGSARIIRHLNTGV